VLGRSTWGESGLVELKSATAGTADVLRLGNEHSTQCERFREVKRETFHVLAFMDECPPIEHLNGLQA
jgi:hypothetical protein